MAETDHARGFQCVGLGQDDLGCRYILMECDGVKIEPLLFETLSEDARFFSQLRAANVPVVTKAAKAAFMSAVQSAPTEVTHYVASRLGWHLGNTVFVLPNRIIGTPKRPMEVALLHLDQSMREKYRARGSLTDWQTHVLPLCENNSRLMFAMAAAFASAVAAIVPEAETGGGFEVVSEPEQGKTGAVMAFGSAWGCHLGQAKNAFCEDWNTTINEVEPTLFAHNNIGLPIDEAGLFEGDHRLAIMRLAEGGSKRRMLTAGRTMSRAFFFSTANDPVWDRIKASPTSLAATVSRCFNVPLPKNGFGIFDDLHGHTSGAKLTTALKLACLTNFGTAGPTFVEAFLQALEDNREAVLEYVRNRRRRFHEIAEKKAKARSLPTLQRPLDRFATCYAAGCLAIAYGILPWDKNELRRAILTCYLDGLEFLPSELLQVTTGKGRGQMDGRPPMERLKAYVQDNIAGFKRVGAEKDEDAFGSAPGYRAYFKSKKWFYFDPKAFRQIVGGLANARAVLTELSGNNLAELSGSSISVQRPFYRADSNKGWHRVVAIRSKAFDNAEAAE